MKGLRTGVTTGLCAAAAAKAATMMLLSECSVTQIQVAAKNGEMKTFEVTDAAYKKDIAQCEARSMTQYEMQCEAQCEQNVAHFETQREEQCVMHCEAQRKEQYVAHCEAQREEQCVAYCAVQKDAGDDPDITHGIKIFASVSKKEQAGIDVDGGEGVGRVTKPGLKVPVGKAAINPVPMEMIKSEIASVCKSYAYTGGVNAVISIPGGAEIAKKTMNGRLGVVGGLSILGTTGIVEPMSNKAIVETIKAEIDILVASGKNDLLITPGNYGREFAAGELGLNIDDAVKCSNFIGETLDYACLKGIERITLIGHAGKLVKLAGGIMNTHSAVADCRMEIIAAHSALMGAGAEAIRQIMACATTETAVEVLKQIGANESVWDSIGQKINFHLRERTRGSLVVEYIVFTQEHGILCKGTTLRRNAPRSL